MDMLNLSHNHESASKWACPIQKVHAQTGLTHISSKETANNHFSWVGATACQNIQNISQCPEEQNI